MSKHLTCTKCGPKTLAQVLQVVWSTLLPEVCQILEQADSSRLSLGERARFEPPRNHKDSLLQAIFFLLTRALAHVPKLRSLLVALFVIEQKDCRTPIIRVR